MGQLTTHILLDLHASFSYQNEEDSGLLSGANSCASGTELVLCELGVNWPERGPWKARQEHRVLRVAARAQHERAASEAQCARSSLCDIGQVTQPLWALVSSPAIGDNAHQARRLRIACSAGWNLCWAPLGARVWWMHTDTDAPLTSGCSEGTDKEETVAGVSSDREKI